MTKPEDKESCSNPVERVVSGANNNSISNTGFVYFDGEFLWTLKTKVGAKRYRNQKVRVIKKASFASRF